MRNPIFGNFGFIKYKSGSVLFFLGLMLIIPTTNSHSQAVQVWLDGFVYKQFGKNWEYEGNIGVNKLIQNQGWGDIYLSNTVSKDIKPWYAAEGGLEFHYTQDLTSSDVTEIRPWITQKFILPKYWSKIHLEKPYISWRLDVRFLGYPEEDTTDIKSRIRMRIGCRFLLNNTSLTAKTFYIPFYFENFFNVDGEAFERYATKNRTMIGIGYVFNTKWRSEFAHYVQRSRNTLGDAITRSDLIFQLKVKYYLDG